jgi:chromosome segregation ATPase
VFHDHDKGDDATEAAMNQKLVVAETLRSSAQSSSKSEDDEGKGEHMSLFWRVFGGTILSISSLIVITLYNNLSTGISDLRTDLNKERDARADLIKKDDYSARSAAISEHIRNLDALKPELEGLRERVTANAASVEGVKKDTGAAVEEFKKEVTSTLGGLKKNVGDTTDLVKKDETQMEILKERVASLDSLKKDVEGIEVLKDKIATASADLKAVRDEVAKLQQSAERSRSTEIERKATQDIQLKQVEETLKEMQKGLQDCREKLARLEGAQPAPPKTASGTTKP